MVNGRPLAGSFAGLLVLGLVLSGCTGDDEPSPAPAAPSPSASAPSAPAGPSAAPLEVRIAGSAGRLPKRARLNARQRIENTVGDYLEGAFLGEFPRTRYVEAWSRFTPAAKRQARGDLGILTHADRGARIASVLPVRQEVRVQTVAPRRRVIGGTARIRLVLRVTDADGGVQRVRIAGRLMLTRAADRSFRIFGYDLRRSSGRVRTPGGGS